MSTVTEPSNGSLLDRRWINLLGFLICAASLGFAYFLQFYRDLEPCPLCIFQRLAILALGIVFLVAAAHHPLGWGRRIYALLILVIGGIGAGIAGRHVWLQHLPPEQVPECGPGLDYMLDVFPLSETITTVLQGSGECGEVSWTFLGLSIPTWTLLLFIGLIVMGVVTNWRQAGLSRTA